MRSIHAKPARCALRKPGTGRTLPARLGAHACSCRSTRNRVPGDDLPGGGCRLARALVVHGPRWHCATWCRAPWRRHVKECSDDLAAASKQVQDLCCGLRNVNPLACRYRHDHSPATSLASITNSWQHGSAQRVPCLSMEGSRCAKELVVEPMNGRLYLAVKAYGSGRRACRCATWCFNRCQVHVEISGNGLHPVPPSQLL